MSQTTYSDEMAVGLKGMPADNGPKDIVTYNNPVDLITFGRAVAKVSGDADGIELPDGSGSIIKGVAVRGMTEEHEYFPALSAVPVMKKGRILVEVEQDVTPDSDVYVVYDGRKQQQTLTFDADLITDNVINLKVNGEAISPVTFTSNHNTTMAAIVTAIKALAGAGKVSDATCPGSGSKVITIIGFANGVDFVVSDIVVTAGETQAAGEMAETVASVPDTDKGKFRADANSSRALALTSAKFMTAASAGGLAVLDLNIT